MKRTKILRDGEVVEEDYVARLSTLGDMEVHPELGTIDYASDGAMLARTEVAGTNVIINGMYREHIARISRKDFSSLIFGSLPAYTGDLEGVMPAYVDPGTREWREFMSTRKVVRTELPSGRGEYSLTADMDFDTKIVRPPKPGRAKRYTLAQVFSDSYVSDKYGLTEKMVQSAKVMAVSQPDEAARLLQGAIRQLSVDDEVRVVAGPYSRSRQQAKYTVRHVAGRFRNVSVTIQAMLSDRKIILFGPEGENGWMVCGPVHHIDEIYDVYRMVVHVGTSDPVFLLGMELTILDIDVHNGKEFECPTVEGHAGSEKYVLPMDSSYETQSMLTVEQKTFLGGLVDRILPVRDISGRVVASSVRVTAKHVLYSDHVMEKHPKAHVDDRTVIPLRTISRDLWIARLDGVASAWKLRKPVTNEVAIICYNVGNHIQFSSPMRVESADGYNIMVTKTHDVVPGMSGGALVALSDFSLLGIHCGSTLRHNLCSQFGQEQYTDLCEADSVSQACRDEADETAGENLYDRFKRKGLRSVIDQVIGASVPIYAGHEHVAMSAYMSNSVYTTFDVERCDVKIGETRIAQVFEPSAFGGQYVASAVVPTATSPPVFRNPEHYEKVVLVGRDEQGPYFSQELSVISIGVSHRNFSLSKVDVGDLPLVGSMVVALSDAAVLGQYVRSVASVGIGTTAYCLPLRPRLETGFDDPVKLVQAKFPMLHVSAWSEGIMEEIFSHASKQQYDSGVLFNVGNMPLACVGDSAAKACLYATLRELAVPHSLFQLEMQKYQSNSAFAEIAWKFGLAKLMRAAPGSQFPVTSKAYADLVEALVGGVFLNETRDVFDAFCGALGVIPEVSVGTPKQLIEI